MPPVNELLGQLPPGHVLAPLLPGQENAPLRLCIVFRPDPDPVSGHWILLRQTMDARVLLGALADAAGRLHRYVEIWMQDIGGIRATPAGRRGATNNAVLDQRWSAHHAALLACDSPGIFTTNWESIHPAPTLLAAGTLRPSVMSSDGQDWSLCQDDQALREAGLPPYSTSLDRYLFQPALGAGSRFVPVNAGAAENDRTQPLDALTAQAAAIGLNVAGGLLLVRDFCPLVYGQLVDLLRTGSWEGIGESASIPPIAALAQSGQADSGSAGSGLMMLSRSGPSVRLVETLYLRLGALAGAAAALHGMVRHTGRPVLNLTDESFRAALGPGSPALPLLWTGVVCLTDPGDAIPLALEGAQEQYYLRGSSGGPTIYRPDVSDAGEGRGNFRIRQVLPEGRGIVVEGTFRPQDRLVASRNDLLRVRLGIAAGRVDLYTRLQPEMALAGGEWRLRSVPQSLPQPMVQQLQAAQGVPFPSAEYEHIPLLSTPCDLYALAVLAVRTLLLPPGTPISVALDETYSLARQVAIEYDPATGLPERIAAIFKADERWAQSLGPRVLSVEPLDSDQAALLLPGRIWWDLLAMIVRMFPGVGPDSTSGDYGDAPPNAIHRTFEPLLHDLDALLGMVRTLIVGDERFNREVAGVIQRFTGPSPQAGQSPRAGTPSAASPAAVRATAAVAAR